MASTRTNNTSGNYCLQQKQYQDQRTYTIYKNSGFGEAYNTQLPGNGLNPGQIPWNKLSNNAADIESFLFGINSTNLVNRAPPLTPDLITLNTANIFKTSPVYLPDPLIVEKYQRPFVIP